MDYKISKTKQDQEYQLRLTKTLFQKNSKIKKKKRKKKRLKFLKF